MLISMRECDQIWAIFKALLFRKPPFCQSLLKPPYSWLHIPWNHPPALRQLQNLHQFILLVGLSHESVWPLEDEPFPFHPLVWMCARASGIFWKSILHLECLELRPSSNSHATFSLSGMPVSGRMGSRDFCLNLTMSNCHQRLEEVSIFPQNLRSSWLVLTISINRCISVP